MNIHRLNITNTHIQRKKIYFQTFAEVYFFNSGFAVHFGTLTEEQIKTLIHIFQGNNEPNTFQPTLHDMKTHFLNTL